MAYGCMGGDGQPQTQGAVFTRHVTFGEPLAEAIDRRAGCWGGPGAPRDRAALEPRFDGNLVDALAVPATMSSLCRTLFRRHGPRRRRGAA
jgi:hypothetical protein